MGWSQEALGSMQRIVCNYFFLHRRNLAPLPLNCVWSMLSKSCWTMFVSSSPTSWMPLESFVSSSLYFSSFQVFYALEYPFSHREGSQREQPQVHLPILRDSGCHDRCSSLLRQMQVFLKSVVPDSVVASAWSTMTQVRWRWALPAGRPFSVSMASALTAVVPITMFLREYVSDYH